MENSGAVLRGGVRETYMKKKMLKELEKINKHKHECGVLDEEQYH